jgi:hypothetical protein
MTRTSRNQRGSSIRQAFSVRTNLSRVALKTCLVQSRVGDDPSIGKAGEQRGAKEPGGKEEGGGKAGKLKSAFTQTRKLKVDSRNGNSSPRRWRVLR